MVKKILCKFAILVYAISLSFCFMLWPSSNVLAQENSCTKDIIKNNIRQLGDKKNSQNVHNSLVNLVNCNKQSIKLMRQDNDSVILLASYLQNSDALIARNAAKILSQIGADAQKALEKSIKDLKGNNNNQTSIDEIQKIIDNLSRIGWAVQSNLDNTDNSLKKDLTPIKDLNDLDLSIKKALKLAKQKEKILDNKELDYLDLSSKLLTKKINRLTGKKTETEKWEESIYYKLIKDFITPAVLFLTGGVITILLRNNQNKIEDERNERQSRLEKENIKADFLANYFDKMISLMADKGLTEADHKEPIAKAAQALTVTAFLRLDENYGKEVTNFLFSSKLAKVGESQPVILKGCDLSGKDLHEYYFNRLDLSNSNLSNSNLTMANFQGADLSNANLSNANLTDANLTDANLTDANLTDANLTDANLTDANLTDVNLTRTLLTCKSLNNEGVKPEILNLIVETNILIVDYQKVFISIAKIDRVDILLSAMEKQIHGYINTSKLQDLLAWADEIVDPSPSDISRLGKRAIATYFSIILAYANAEAEAKANALAEAEAEGVAYANAEAEAKANALAEAEAEGVAYANAEGEALANALAYAYAYAYAYAREAEAKANALANAYAYAREAYAYAYAKAKANPREANAKANAYAYAYAKAYAKAYAYLEKVKKLTIYKNVDFDRLLVKLLKEQISEENLSRKTSKNFLKDLNLTLLKGFNLTEEKIDFSVEEFNSLENYFNAAKLMLDCKNAAGDRLSQKTWNEIEDRMLRPTVRK